MKFDVITLFPEMITDYCSQSIMKRAIESNTISVSTTNPREYTLDKHKKVDDTPYGGGAGMVMTPQPLYDAIMSVKTENSYVIYLSPRGRVFKQAVAKELASKEGILCGISSGTNVAAAKKLAKKLGKGKTVIAVLPDTAERYFSTPLFDE